MDPAGDVGDDAALEVGSGQGSARGRAWLLSPAYSVPPRREEIPIATVVPGTRLHIHHAGPDRIAGLFFRALLAAKGRAWLFWLKYYGLQWLLPSSTHSP